MNGSCPVTCLWSDVSGRLFVGTRWPWSCVLMTTRTDWAGISPVSVRALPCTTWGWTISSVGQETAIRGILSSIKATVRRVCMHARIWKAFLTKANSKTSDVRYQEKAYLPIPTHGWCPTTGSSQQSRWGWVLCKPSTKHTLWSISKNVAWWTIEIERSGVSLVMANAMSLSL